MIKKLIFSLFFLSFICSSYENEINLKEHEIWWTVHKEMFRTWLLDTDSASRIKVREHVKKMAYRNLLDAACGHCAEYFGYKQDKIDIDYYGLDITKHLVDDATAYGLNVVRASIEDIPYQDSFFDLAYARHILEHLEYYEKAINELIRVAKKEVIIVFFISLGEVDKIDRGISNGFVVYHNNYAKDKLFDYIKSNKKVKNLEFEEVNFCASNLNLRNETNYILHIYLK